MAEWLNANTGNLLVLLVLGCVVAGILYGMYRDKKKGRPGCSGCSGCAGCRGCTHGCLLDKQNTP